MEMPFYPQFKIAVPQDLSGHGVLFLFCDAENLTRVVQRPYLLFVTESNVFSTSKSLVLGFNARVSDYVLRNAMANN